MPVKVLITGGNGDIAKAIKAALEADGYSVYAPGRSDMDVTDSEKVKSVINTYKPDILINNAGYVVPQSVKNSDFENTKKHIDINLLGVFWCTEAALNNNPDTVIVNIGSAAAVETHATWSEYCATKAAVVMATKCWAEDGVYTVCISPGRTRTKMRESLFGVEDRSTLLDPDDFAKVVVKAVKKEYASGSHIIVRKQNVDMILKGECEF